MHKPLNPFRLNVGFFYNQPVGYSRDFLFDLPEVTLPPDLDLSDLAGRIHITRTAQGLLVQAKMKATLHAECVRCLNEFPLSLEVDFTELYALNRQNAVDSELVVPETGYLNLSPILREYMYLEVPISPLCSQQCQGLCPICGENRNEVACNHEEDNIDPRLSALRSLLNKE